MTVLISKLKLQHSLSTSARPNYGLHVLTITMHTEVCLFICLFGVLRRFQHCTGHITTGAEETSTYSSLGFCTVNCRPTASNYQLSHLRPWRGSNPGRRGGRLECYNSATVAPCIQKW